MLNGVAFKLKVDDSESITKRRVILSALKREEMGEKIDNKFRAIQKEEPNLRSYQIYSKISDESKVLLGLELSPRQVEGKHRTYVQVSRKAKKTKCMDVNIPYGEPCRPHGTSYIDRTN